MVAKVVLVGILLNVGSVTGVVLINKAIAARCGFHAMVLLSALHFVATTLAVRVMKMLGVFAPRQAEPVDVLKVAMCSLLSVAFMNLNLAFNSVGFYQLTKIACVPLTIAVQYAWFHVHTPRNVQLTLIPICIGVAVATVTEVGLTSTGLIYAVCASIATVLAQIYTNRVQKKCELSAFQLLYLTSPYITVGMFVSSFFLDNLTEVYSFQVTTEFVVLTLLSCVCAVAVNVSNYLVLGKTSPLTYQVLGHFKTILVLLLGFWLFANKVNYHNVLGILIALVGVIAYSEVKRRDGPAAPRSKPNARLSGPSSASVAGPTSLSTAKGGESV